MTNMVKRFVALTAAGLLFVSAAFTSLAEEITEGDILPAETEEMTTPEVTASEITETSETIPEPVYQEPEAAEEASPAPESEPETVPQEAEPVKQEADTAKETSPVTESKPEKEEADDDGDTETFDDEDDDYDFIFDDFDQGSVDTDLTEIYFPNGGGPTAETGESTEQTEGTEEAGNIAAPQATALRIVPESGRAIRVGEQAVLNAEAETEIVGDITWEILDESLEEETWETIGLGRQLLLDVTEEILNRQIRFVLEDGSASEIYVLTEMEAQEEPEQEEEAQTTEEQDEEETAETAAETEEQTEVQNDEETAESADAEETDEESAAETEEETVEITRAWISAETAEDGTVILTANADPEMTGINIWETRRAEEEEDAWQRIAYGDTVTVQPEEAGSSLYRFTMQNGFVSEAYALAAPAETFARPENVEVSFHIGWEDEARLGGTARFTADVSGLEGYEYSMQWQWSEDSENWHDVEGETGDQMLQVITEENSAYFWRINVTVTGTK